MSQYDNLEGMVFGKLSVIKREGKLGHDKAYLCKCECGNQKVIRGCSLVSGNTSSCGCLKKFKDLSGMKFGNWTVIKFSHKNNRQSPMWECVCNCENKTNKIVEGTSLKAGKSKSCGCIKNVAIKHGKTRQNVTDIDSKLYHKWESMKQRCYNKNSNNYGNYGARGIRLCDEWKNDFMNFYNWAIESGYVVGLTIDRIDVDGIYEPDNCRWLTHEEQQNNRQYHHYITYKGETRNVRQWEKLLGFNDGVLRVNILSGKTMDEILKKRGIAYGN